jgi:hypothetical protein
LAGPAAGGLVGVAGGAGVFPSPENALLIKTPLKASLSLVWVGGVSVGFPWGFRGLPGLSRGLLGHSGEWGAFPLAGPAAGGLVGVAGGVVANCWWPSAGAGSRNKSVKNRNQQTPKVNGKHG